MPNSKSPTHDLLEQVFALEERGVRDAIKKKYGDKITEDQIRCIIADNVIRKAVEVLFHNFTPFDAALVPEIANRSAAIILSALPEEAREWGATKVAFAIHDTVKAKTAQGFQIGSVWDNGNVN